MQRPVSSLGQRFFDGLLRARRTQATKHHFSTLLLFQAEPFLEGIDVRLVDLKAKVGFLDPGCRLVHAEDRVTCRDLLEANDEFHGDVPSLNPAESVILSP